jgi:hypothetical protein
MAISADGITGGAIAAVGVILLATATQAGWVSKCDR